MCSHYCYDNVCFKVSSSADACCGGVKFYDTHTYPKVVVPDVKIFLADRCNPCNGVSLIDCPRGSPPAANSYDDLLKTIMENTTAGANKSVTSFATIATAMLNKYVECKGKVDIKKLDEGSIVCMQLPP